MVKLKVKKWACPCGQCFPWYICGFFFFFLTSSCLPLPGTCTFLRRLISMFPKLSSPVSSFTTVSWSVSSHTWCKSWMGRSPLTVSSTLYFWLMEAVHWGHPLPFSLPQFLVLNFLLSFTLHHYVPSFLAVRQFHWLLCTSKPGGLLSFHSETFFIFLSHLSKIDVLFPGDLQFVGIINLTVVRIKMQNSLRLEY